MTGSPEFRPEDRLEGLAMLSHELNQPLTALMLYLRAAEQALPSEPASAPARTILDKAIHETERATAIARKLQSLSGTSANHE